MEQVSQAISCPPHQDLERRWLGFLLGSTLVYIRVVFIELSYAFERTNVAYCVCEAFGTVRYTNLYVSELNQTVQLDLRTLCMLIRHHEPGHYLFQLGFCVDPCFVSQQL